MYLKFQDLRSELISSIGLLFFREAIGGRRRKPPLGMFLFNKSKEDMEVLKMKRKIMLLREMMVLKKLKMTK